MAGNRLLEVVIPAGTESNRQVAITKGHCTESTATIDPGRVVTIPGLPALLRSQPAHLR